MAEKSAQLILDALGKALTEPAGLVLHSTRSVPGLFGTTAAARQAARQCKSEGWLQVLRAEPRGKAIQEVCGISEKGLAHLFSQLSPKSVLESLVRALEARQMQVAELVSAARETEATFAALRDITQQVLQQFGPPALPILDHPATNGTPSWQERALADLVRWAAAHPAEDCPLPELFGRVRQADGRLTIGRFHDGLRELHEQGRVYLHPWTGPLDELPEPAYALLIGHEVLYYVSLRS